MTILTTVVSWGIWLSIATVIIIVIFRMFLTYLGVLESNMPK